MTANESEPTARPEAGTAVAGDAAHALLARHFWGVLTAVDGAAPYAVPVIYGWDGRAAYVLMLPGRKEQLLRAHPHACLSVIDGVDGGSVLLRGRAEWVEALPAKVHAADVVRRQMAGRRAPSVRDAARLVHACILRLVPEAVEHRARAFDLPD